MLAQWLDQIHLDLKLQRILHQNLMFYRFYTDFIDWNYKLLEAVLDMLEIKSINLIWIKHKFYTLQNWIYTTK